MSDSERSDNNGFWKHFLDGKQYTQLPTLWQNDPGSGDSQAQPDAYQTTIIPYFVSREVVLCAWTQVLSLFTGLEDVAFDVVLEDGFSGSSDRVARFPFCNSRSRGSDSGCTAGRVAQLLEEIQAHQYLSLEQSEPAKSAASLNSNFHTLLRIQTVKGSPEKRATNVIDGNDEIPVKLTFHLSERSTEVGIFFHQHLYQHQYIGEVLKTTVFAIRGVLNQSDKRDNEINLDLILSWTSKCASIPKEPLLHTGIENQSRLRPRTIAVGETERVMTYQELNSGADLIADSFEAECPGYNENQNVGVYFEKSAFAIMSMLAVLKSGKTYVPLDVAWPQERVKTVIGNAKIHTVICSREQRSRLPEQALQTLIVDEALVYELKIRWKGQHRTRLQIDPSTPAYILYTSGSTGTPKGISVSHTAISTSIQAMAQKLKINPRTRTFQYTTFTFDLNIADVWMTLCYGGRICLPSEDERLHPNDFIVQERCNYAMITPTAASTIDPVTMHANIDTLALIGEAVPEQLLQKIATNDGSLNLYNTWGPTEASVIASSSKSITAASDSSPSIYCNNIGYPVGCSIFLVSLDDPKKLAPAFAPGEIALVGHTLANGYYGDSTRTKEAFRTDLTWAKDKAVQAKVGDAAAMRKVYLTGDVGRYNSNGDGTIIFMYRKEGGYIKVNGYRIDPGEIESRISRTEGQMLFENGLCVLAHQQPASEREDARQVLVCFFVVSRDQENPEVGFDRRRLDSEMKVAIRNVSVQLQKGMPDYMIPRLFVPLQSMPTLTSHKIDRKALAKVIAGRSWQDLLARYGY